MKNDRVKMTSMVVLVMLVSTGLLMFLSYHRASRSMTDQLELNYSVTAEKYAQELTAWVNTNATIIDTIAAEITVSGIYDRDYDEFHAFLAENCRILNQEGSIYDIYFTYPDNRMACASDFLADGTVDYTHERDWFTVAAGTGELFYSTPYRDSDSGKPVITISKAVYRNNTLQGVLAADIFVDVLVDIIRGADIAADSYAFLVDQNLGMIAHPDEAYAFDDTPRGVMSIPGAPYAEVISKIRSGSSETVYLRDYDGVTRGVAVARMANTGWYVGIATSRAVLMRGMRSLARGFVIAAVTAVAAGGVIAVLLAQVLEKLRRQQQDAKERSRRLPNQADPAESPKPRATGSAAAEKDFAGKSNLRVPILVILLLMICMVLYTTRVINRVAVTNIREVGEDRLSAAAAQLENYLETAKSTLWVTADSVDHMVHSGIPTQDILDYIMEETEHQKQKFDVNITGLYGYVRGEYLDGLAWVPPENYDPTRRDWYLQALAAGGETVIVSPYVDAQTDAVVISICRALSNGRDVVSVDLMMDHIQEIISDLQIKGKGYGFIVDRDGMLIAHQDEALKGHLLTDDERQLALMDEILAKRNGIFEIASDRGKQTVFVRQLVDQWYIVIVIDSRELMAEVHQQLAVNVLICAVIYALITIFYVVGRRNERSYARRIEQMRAEEQRQAFEARALKLEKEAADQANKAKSDFLADMSHEIRTPINAVLGMNEIILRQTLEARNASGPEGEAFRSIGACARNIESAGNSLLAIINDILDFSKIEAGKMDIVEGEYQLSSLLNDLSSMFSFKARDKGLDFQIDVDKTLPDGLYGDEVRMRQIITNLLNNAVKYTERGVVTLTVRGEPQDDGTIRMVAAVRDTGIGIRPEDIGKLFSKFQRVDLKQNSTVEGTGLGLAITRSLLDMMGGSIGVESEYGKGSVFTVSLPQKIVSSEPVGDFRARFLTDSLEAEPYRESFRAPDARILIVDDTKMNLTVAVGLLKNTLLQIDTASSGREAIRLCRDTAYDLILMDQRMPKMDGTEALHRIREQPGGRNTAVPVICLTADAVIGAKDRYLAEGFTDYLTKPIDSRALEQMLMKYLPAEKVTAVHASDRSAPESSGDRDTALRRAGIEPDIGLRCCQQDRQLYQSVLQEYAQGAPEKRRQLQKFFAARDWKEYSVLVHAVKSSSRMIGAQALAEMAAALEAAADEGRADAVESGHAAMLSHYEETARAILQVLPAEPAPQDDEIMEFLPEDSEGL